MPQSPVCAKFVKTPSKFSAEFTISWGLIFPGKGFLPWGVSIMFWAEWDFPGERGQSPVDSMFPQHFSSGLASKFPG